MPEEAPTAGQAARSSRQELPGKDDLADDDQPKPRALHKTSSIFLRNLAPTITKQEVEAMCKRYDGFLRCSGDGSCTDPRDWRLARGGAALYFGPRHCCNSSALHLRG